VSRLTARLVFGVHPRTCPGCKFHGRFRAAGMPPRFDAECPRCHTYERHRLLLLADQRTPLVPDGAELLHVAPERVIGDHFRARCKKYVTLDLHEAADVNAPLENTGLPDRSFDVVICSHVLEHVDDTRALAELHRILRPRGVALVMVPLVDGWDATYEDRSITSPGDRDLHFGQNDHVRYYGRDIRDRIRRAGFAITEITAAGPDVVTYSLHRGEKLFVAVKEGA
jgi:predicted SAM-dependent methyltransferase